MWHHAAGCYVATHRGTCCPPPYFLDHKTCQSQLPWWSYRHTFRLYDTNYCPGKEHALWSGNDGAWHTAHDASRKPEFHKTSDVSRVTVAVPWQCKSNGTVSTVWWASSVSVHQEAAVPRCCQMYILALLPTWTGSTWCWQKPKSRNAIAKAAWCPRTNL